MGANRFHFADDEHKSPPSTSVWVTRAVIAGVMVGLAAAAYIVMGWSLFH